MQQQQTKKSWFVLSSFLVNLNETKQKTKKKKVIRVYIDWYDDDGDGASADADVGAGIHPCYNYWIF